MNITTQLSAYRITFFDKDKEPILITEQDHSEILNAIRLKQDYITLAIPNGVHTFSKKNIKEISPISSAEREAYTRQKYIGYWEETLIGVQDGKPVYKKSLMPMQFKGESDQDYQKRKKPSKEITGYYNPGGGFIPLKDS